MHPEESLLKPRTQKQPHGPGINTSVIRHHMYSKSYQVGGQTFLFIGKAIIQMTTVNCEMCCYHSDSLNWHTYCALSVVESDITSPIILCLIDALEM